MVWRTCSIKQVIFQPTRSFAISSFFSESDNTEPVPANEDQSSEQGCHSLVFDVKQLMELSVSFTVILMPCDGGDN